MTKHIMNFIDYIRTERNYSDHTETNYLIDLEAYELYLKNRKLKSFIFINMGGIE